MVLRRCRAPAFIALLLSVVSPVLAQVEEVYYDPSMITDAVPENCRGHCTPISQTFEACLDTNCLCTRENNQILLRCVNCLYFDEPGAQTYEVAQRTLKDFSVVCIDYHLAALTVSTTSSTSRPAQTPSSTPRPPSTTSPSPSQASRSSSTSIPPSRTPSTPTPSTTPTSTTPSASSQSSPNATASSTSPATTSAFPPVPQECRLVFHRKQRVLVRRGLH